MKKILNIFLIFFGVTLLMSACTKNNELFYNETPSVYFYASPGSQDPPRDSINYTFLGKADTVTKYIVPVWVRITGVATNSDRKFSVQVLSTTTAKQGTNFDIATGIIPAGKYDTRLNVTLKRTADLKTTQYVIFLKMIASADFKTGYDKKLTYKIGFTEMAIKPANWPQSYYGDYSVAKLTFMYQILGSNIDWGAYPPVHMANSALLRSELAKYEKANGPLIDAATGVRVVFPG
jgi:hypothetical protein